MAFWLGNIAFVVIITLITLGFKQRYTLVPIFEKEPMLRDAAELPGFPFSWLEGPFLTGARYAWVLGLVALIPAVILEREGATLPCTKAEFLRYFSKRDIRRAVVFTVLGHIYLVLITVGYFLMPTEEAR